MRKPCYDFKKWTLELIYERLQQEAADDPTILNLKQDTAHKIKQITGCGSSTSFNILKDLEREYDFKTYGKNDERIFSIRELAKIDLKHKIGMWYDNRTYYSAIGYLLYCKKTQKEPDIVKWYQNYLKKFNLNYGETR